MIDIKKIFLQPTSKRQRRILYLLTFLIVVIQLFYILYTQQEVFTKQYDVAYWKERFEHSQWVLPLSTRSIGDEALFAYVGYELIHGLDPTSVNVETPPLGKYLIGLSIYLFDNPAYYAFIVSIFTYLLMLVLFSHVLKDRLGAFILSTIVFLDPLIFSQSWLVLLDGVQLAFLLVNFIAILMLKKSKNIIFPILAGIGLGLFFGTKFPVLFPVILILETAFFLLILKKLRPYSLFIIGIFISVLIPYTKYFLLGNSLLDYIRIQKFILNFYSASELDVHIGAVWSVIISGQFPNLISGEFEKISEWTLLWPVILILSLLYGIKVLKEKKNLFIFGLLIFVCGSLAIYTFIPFYPRYLVLLLPFLYLFSFLLIKTYIKKLILFVPVLLFCFISARMYLEPVPDKTLEAFYSNLSYQNFNDIYREQLSREKPAENMNEFHLKSKKFMNDAAIEYLTVKTISKQKISDSEIIVDVKIDYYTRYLGEFSESKSINLTKESSKWKIKWNWETILNGLKPEYSIRSRRFLGRRGTLVDDQGSILARDESGYIISVDPSRYESKKEEQLLKLLCFFISQSSVRLQNRYLIDNSLGDIDIGTNFKTIPEKQKDIILSYKGVKIRQYPTRVYYFLDPKSIGNNMYPECCSRIYSSYNFHGITGAEKKYDSKLWGYDGGSIEIIDNERVVKKVFSKNKKDGEDVVVPTLN